MISLLAVLVLLLVSFCDPIRDASGKQGWSWWRWHLVKWTAWYPAVGFIFFQNVWPHGWIPRVGVPIAALVMWRLGLKVTGKQWGDGIWIGSVKRAWRWVRERH